MCAVGWGRDCCSTFQCTWRATRWACRAVPWASGERVLCISPGTICSWASEIHSLRRRFQSNAFTLCHSYFQKEFSTSMEVLTVVLLTSKKETMNPSFFTFVGSEMSVLLKFLCQQHHSILVIVLFSMMVWLFFNGMERKPIRQKNQKQLMSQWE